MENFWSTNDARIVETAIVADLERVRLYRLFYELKNALPDGVGIVVAHIDGNPLSREIIGADLPLDNTWKRYSEAFPVYYPPEGSEWSLRMSRDIFEPPTDITGLSPAERSDGLYHNPSAAVFYDHGRAYVKADSAGIPWMRISEDEYDEARRHNAAQY